MVDQRQAPTTAPSRQQIKSAEMRRRTCEATTHCLATLGYPSTSIKQVIKAAGISQGALQHHFPSKEDLVTATAAFLLRRSIKWFTQIKAELEKDRSAFGKVTRRSWADQFATEEYEALLQILVASRTDATLKTRIAPKLEDWREAIEGEMRDLLTPIARDADELNALLTIGRCMMTGLLVHDGLLDDKERIETVIDAWIDIVAKASR
ncbi:TetR/AcrR family transcriptional regulator [Hyphococcus lacteus]|uniref:TetR/AcrR family transcriptional regulator n=1 Tax=Hyphococcus lacteus TaxID=3143536 RepID=A0ABV3Z8F9_9PROT